MYKNLLQEYHQKKSYILPTYESNRVSNDKVEWQSTVTIYNGQKFTGDIKSTKSAADISAAYFALLYLKENIKYNKRKISSNTALLVDVENLPLFVQDVCDNFEGLTIYAFIGTHHCLASRSYDPSVIKVISPSNRPDGTDTCMQMYIGYLLALNKYDSYIIATRDHFGAALVELINSHNLPWQNRPAKLITTIDQI